MKLPFTKAHGSKNDFLLSWRDAAPAGGLPELAIAICDRHTGIGADGWMLVDRGAGDVHGAIQLINSDGSASEISGNGTRCAAAFLIDAGLAADTIRIATGAGPKALKLLSRAGNAFEFEMDMGRPHHEEGAVRTGLAIGGRSLDVTIINVGNPQCVVFVDDFGLDWRAIGKEIEWHARFPNRTNVSFVRVVDGHTIDVRFWERGAGETMSSGTGSTGAVAAAALRGLVTTPARALTPAGPLHLRLESDTIYLTGPAEIIGSGEYYF